MNTSVNRPSDTLYIVTGAAGFLGNNVCRTLIAQGRHVRALALANDPAAAHVPAEAELVYGDLTARASLEPLFNAENHSELVVIHCASLVALSPEPSPKVYDVNVAGTEHIVDLCVERGVQKLVYISSTGAIPELPHGVAIGEPEEFLPDAVVGYYAKTKALATQYVQQAVQERGLDASIVYPTGICGPDDYAFGPVAGFIISYCSGHMSVGVEGSFNSVDVRDLAEGVVSCADRGRSGEGYIMGNEKVSMRRMFDLISETSGAKLVRTILSPAEMEAAAINGSSGEKSESELSALRFGIYNLVRNNDFSSEKAIAELGYHTRPFEETIADSVRWLQAEGKI